MRVLIWVAIVCFAIYSSAWAGDFEKVGFIDVYQALIQHTDTSGLHPETYYSQLHDLGITKVVSKADSVSTANPYGIQIMGSDWGMMIGDTIGDVWELDKLVHSGYNIYLEAENEQSLNGYTWVRYGGVEYSVSDTTGWLFRSGEDDAGLVMYCDQGLKYGHDMHPRFTMKVWDTTTVDTLCRIEVDYSKSCQVWVDSLHKYILVDSAKTSIYYFTGTDFDEPGAWKEFDSTLSYFPATSGYSWLNTRVYWNGLDSIAFDEFTYVDVWGRYLETMSDNTLASLFTAYYSRINTANHGRFYPSDEPYPVQFWGTGRYDRLASGISPGHKINAEVGAWCTEAYDYQIDPLENFFADYPFYSEIDSFTTSSTTSVQHAYDEFTTALANDGAMARDWDLPFWMALQVGEFCDANGNCNHRCPSAAELKAMIGLSVLYGASGVCYFTYASTYHSGLQAALPYTDVMVHTEPPSSRSTQVDIRGLVDWDPVTEHYDKNVNWYAAQAMNNMIDSLWPILDGGWQDAGSWKDAKSVTNSILDSIYSVTFPAESTFIEIGRFTHDTDSYLMFVNRRSSAADYQNVTLILNNTQWTMELYDPYRDTAYAAFDSCGHAKVTLAFNPGETRLFRIREMQWAGPVSGTWPAMSKHKLGGDITVDTGDTLTFGQGVQIQANAFSDAMGSGSNTSKTELIVKGHLEAVGTSSNRIQLKSSTDTVAAWYGVRVIDGGSANIRYADLKNAYIGYSNTSTETTNPDALQFVAFSKCKPSAAILANGNMVVSNIGVTSDRKTAEGIHVDSPFHGDITDCTFDYVKYPVEVDHSHPRLSNFSFNECNYGIWIDNYGVSDTVKIDSCYSTHFDSLSTADVVIGQDLSKARIDSCYFDNVKGPYGILNIYNGSYIHVRHSWFSYHGDHSGTAMIYTKGQNTNLGVNGDAGHNVFFQPTLYSYFIYNSSTANTTMARYCCFATQNPPETQYFHGSVDYLYYVYENCGELPKAVVHTDISKDSGEVSFMVLQNHPNPFNPTTTIVYSVPEACYVTVRVYNTLGQVVTTLVDEYKAPGAYAVVWDGDNADGGQVASGMYFYQMAAGEFVSSKKMLMLK